MKIQRAAVLLTLLLTVSAANAQGKDEAYYKAHPEEAKAKYAECEKKTEELAAEGKFEEIMKLGEDPECKAADTVIKFYQNK